MLYVYKLCLYFIVCIDDGCSMDKWLLKLEFSNWFIYVKDILICVCIVVQCIDSEGKLGKFLLKLKLNFFIFYYVYLDNVFIFVVNFKKV